VPTGTRWTFAGDEAGHLSFRFDKGATRYFVVAIIGTTQPDVLRQSFWALRQKQGLPENFDFGFHHVTARQLRRVLFETIEQLDFRVWLTVADKSRFHDSFKLMIPRSFYTYMVTEAVRLIPLYWRENATLLLDEFDRSGKTLAELKKALKILGVERGFKQIRARRSESESLIQIADLAAGATLRHYQKQDDVAYRWLEPKVEAVRMVRE
jgi:hypothetical protein